MFGYIENTITSLFSFLPLDWMMSTSFIIWYCLTMVVIFCFFFTKLVKQKHTLTKAIAKARNCLNESIQLGDKKQSETSFYDNFTSINASLTENYFFKHQWSEFCESLIHHCDQQSGHQVIQNTYNAACYFNEQTTINPHYNSRMFSAVPNYLTGLGILGTFIGLAAGIHFARTGLAQGLNSENTEALKMALGNLLDGAGLAFITSIFGMVLSIIFSVVEKMQYTAIREELDSWNDALDACVHRITTEDMATQQVALLEKQYDALVVMSNKQSELSDKHFDLGQKIGNEQIELLKEQRDLFTDFGNTIAVNISENLGNALSPAFETIINELQKLRDAKSDESKEFISKVTSDFVQELQGSTGKQMSELASTLENLNTTLIPLITDFKEIQKKNVETMSTMADILGKADTLVNGLDAATEKIKTSSDTLIESTEKSSLSIKDAIKAAELTCQELKTQQNHLRDEHTQNQQIFAATAESMKSQHDSLTETWENYERRFTELDQALENAFKSISDGCQAFAQQTDTYMRNLDEHLANALSSLGGVVRELSDSTEELSASVKDWLDDLKKQP